MSMITSVAAKGFRTALKHPVATGTLALQVLPEYNQSRDQGSSVLGSAAKAGTLGLLRYSNPIAMGIFDAAPMLYDGYKAANDFRKRRNGEIRADISNARNNVIGGNYVDTQQAQTMRQAALQQIQGNKLNARSALGGEARIFSPYAARSI